MRARVAYLCCLLGLMSCSGAGMIKLVGGDGTVADGSTMGEGGQGLAGGTGGGGGTGGSGATGGGGSGGPGGSGTGGSDGPGGSGTGGSVMGPDAGPPNLGATAASMELLSRDVPAFAPGSPDFRGPAAAHDTQPNSGWAPPKLPAFLAYDLSGASPEKRANILVSWHAIHNGGFIASNTDGSLAMPVDYTIDINNAPGGGPAPTDGWTEIHKVTGGNRGTNQFLVTLGTGNWVRINVTRSSSTTGALEIDMDVYAAPSGATDSWMFMGDSITYITMQYPFCDLPAQVNAVKRERWPAYINGAQGGTSAETATRSIDDTLSGFPGRYVVLAYGTNDHADEFPGSMEKLVQTVLKLGKIPVVPHLPWAAGKIAEFSMEVASIDALYVKYPGILRGPDLWALFQNRTDLIPANDIHPNGKGQDVLRAEWAKFIAGQP
jgi:lysophospholipase L1-like esterase